VTGYPAPPWHTVGWAAFAPFLVRADDVRLPPALTLESRAGFALGLLGLVDYRAPSPLVYRELVWMPGRVRAKRGDCRVARGWFVGKMLVDDRRSLAAGRELWGLPKQLARFAIGEREARVESEDGARITLALGRRWLPALPGRSTIVTLQSGAELVRFRGETKGAVGLRSLSLRSLECLDGTWRSLETAVPLSPFFGLELRRFRTVMCSPERL
jgi:hypothetical protein